jgi:hypothetical protein
MIKRFSDKFCDFPLLFYITTVFWEAQGGKACDQHGGGPEK